MEMSYVKVYQDWTKVTSKLKDAEKGRLIDAVVLYATSGIDTSDQLSGNEQYLFPMFQAYIDRDRQALEDYIKRQSENGSKGGRPKKPKNPPLSDENPKNPPLSDETQKSKEKEKEKEKEYTPLTPQGETAGGTSYIADNLRGMTAGNWDELRSYLEDGLTMELVNHAVDEAAANGKRNWSYVRGILNRFLEQGITSVEQAKNTKAPKQPESPRPKYRWVGEDDDC